MYVAPENTAQPPSDNTWCSGISAADGYLRTCSDFFWRTRLARALVEVVSGTPQSGLCHDGKETFQIWKGSFLKRKYCIWALFGVGIPNLGVAVIKHTKYGKSYLKRQFLSGAVYGLYHDRSLIPEPKYALLSEI